MTRDEIEKTKEEALEEVDNIFWGLRGLNRNNTTIYRAATDLKEASDRLFELDSRLEELDEEEPEDESDSYE
jgi:hypothetical protein